MAMLVMDEFVEAELKAERAASGADRFDEVWDGVQVITPPPDAEHEELTSAFASALRAAVEGPRLGTVRAGAYVSDLEEGFRENVRIPDVLVALTGGAARDLQTHWRGGPDFLVEVVAAYDQSREKLPFYATLGVRELLLTDRGPWVLELYRLTSGRFERVGASAPDDNEVLVSRVVPVSFRLLAGQPRPRIEVTHQDGVQRWLV